MSKQTWRAVCAIEKSKYSNPVKIRHCDSIGQVETHHTHLTVVREDSMVEMTIDLANLIDWMGRRALASTRGVSKLQDGLIVAKCVGKRGSVVVREREIPIPSYAVAVNPVEA